MDAARPLAPLGFDSGPPADAANRVTPKTGEEVGRVTPMMEQYIDDERITPDLSA